ncbi:phosphonate utilization associated transcriptional regulator [Noviherbaspirillum denitrificans]|uniref:Phosphonate utilization associated transcriptional regulator n=1 Tax=Noviherbaspirillum denitrificans TaxID=1968433 RepID=A0A254TEI0_9BURK|nr:phosphonate utilization associated transcriptional regulator [Noviherbaspirillum denitrificans]OWW21040.1 phosphonate utilization associated transcriptional regulator [Noviherbaspirillum denitrificans]
MTTHENTVIAMLQQYSLPALVQKEIERQIIAGELTAGSKLNEVAFAERLGVSRGPVREAFRALEATGLVRQEKNKGVVVRQISVEEADEIYEVRSALDELVGRKLAEVITDAQVAELRSLLGRMDDKVAQKDVDGYAALNLQFHDTLVTMTGNRKLLDTYRRLVNELTLYRRTALAQKGTLPVSTREHHEIVDTIATRNPDAAGQIMRSHAMEGRNRMHRAQSSSSPD